MRVTLSHAYSRHNVGDGLLVDLAAGIAADAGARVDAVVAHDTDSFADLGCALPPVATPAGWATHLPPPLVELARGGAGAVAPAAARRRLIDLFDTTDLTLAVGGAYLRMDGRVRARLAFVAIHLLQLRAEASSASPAVHLPQSIGPLPRALWPVVARDLRAAAAVFARDDRSLRFVRSTLGVPAARRAPDLAVLQVTEAPAERVAAPSGRPIFAFRPLTEAPRYEAQLRALLTSHPEAILAHQASARGNDDAAWLASAFPDRPSVPLATALSDHPDSVVVSTRLHGALGAVLAGHPAIHLGYERKSWGAYADLDLLPYVVDARSTFTPRVEQHLSDLRRGAAPFWAPVDARRPALLAERSRIVEAVRRAGA